jgi:hypothetical protein
VDAPRGLLRAQTATPHCHPPAAHPHRSQSSISASLSRFAKEKGTNLLPSPL